MGIAAAATSASNTPDNRGNNNFAGWTGAAKMGVLENVGILQRINIELTPIVQLNDISCAECHG